MAVPSCGRFSNTSLEAEPIRETDLQDVTSSEVYEDSTSIFRGLLQTQQQKGGGGALVEGKRGMSEASGPGNRCQPAASVDIQGSGVVDRCVGYFSGTASDRRLPVCTGQAVINPHGVFLSLKHYSNN